MPEPTLTRRSSLARFGGFVAALAGASAWKVATSEGAGPAGVATGTVTCVLTPEMTEGPDSIYRNAASHS